MWPDVCAITNRQRASISALKETRVIPDGHMRTKLHGTMVDFGSGVDISDGAEFGEG